MMHARLRRCCDVCDNSPSLEGKYSEHSDAKSEARSYAPMRSAPGPREAQVSAAGFVTMSATRCGRGWGWGKYDWRHVNVVAQNGRETRLFSLTAFGEEVFFWDGNLERPRGKIWRRKVEKCKSRFPSEIQRRARDTAAKGAVIRATKSCNLSRNNVARQVGGLCCAYYHLARNLPRSKFSLLQVAKLCCRK